MALDVSRRDAVLDMATPGSVTAAAAFDAVRRHAYVCVLDGAVLALRDGGTRAGEAERREREEATVQLLAAPRPSPSCSRWTRET